MAHNNFGTRPKSAAGQFHTRRRRGPPGRLRSDPDQGLAGAALRLLRRGRARCRRHAGRHRRGLQARRRHRRRRHLGRTSLLRENSAPGNANMSLDGSGSDRMAPPSPPRRGVAHEAFSFDRTVITSPNSWLRHVMWAPSPRPSVSRRSARYRPCVAPGRGQVVSDL
jgi:hypothetical protein